MYDHIAKGRLPAIALSAAALEELRHTFGAEGTYAWQAEIGTSDDKLGKNQSRPSQTVTDWEELIRLLSHFPHIDQLTLTAEFSNVGVLAIAFRNQPPAGGSFVITGDTPEWVEEKRAAVQSLFAKRANNRATRLYNRWIFAILQTAIPLMAACLIVLLMTILLVPAAWIREGYIWWVTAGTLMATLWLGNKISDRLLLYVLNRYPYLRWEQENA